jgi:hypothetical protein
MQLTRHLKPQWFQPLNLKCDFPVSKHAFKFNILYRYKVADWARVSAAPGG